MPRSPIIALFAAVLSIAGQHIHFSFHVLSAVAFVWFLVVLVAEVDREIAREEGYE